MNPITPTQLEYIVTGFLEALEFVEGTHWDEYHPTLYKRSGGLVEAFLKAHPETVKMCLLCTHYDLTQFGRDLFLTTQGWGEGFATRIELKPVLGNGETVGEYIERLIEEDYPKWGVSVSVDEFPPTPDNPKGHKELYMEWLHTQS